MKNIKVQQKYYTLSELYQIAEGSKSRRGLFGYMMKTGRTDNTIMGGAMFLLEKLEDVGHDLYKLIIPDESGREIAAVAEAAMAGAFNDYAMSRRSIHHIARKIEKLGLDY